MNVTKNAKYQKLLRIGQAITQSRPIEYLGNHKKNFAIAAIVIFFVFIGYYISSHPEILQSISRINFANIMLIITAYSCLTLTTAGIIYATIRLCNKTLPPKDSLLLTIYSSIINFFGPMQSGPAARAIYLKRKIGLRIRDYTYAMFFYYFVYGAINTSLLFIGNLPWLSLIGMIIAITTTVMGAKRLNLNPFRKYIFYIFILTAIQAIFMILIYAIELNAINPLAHYSLAQTAIYTGGANLAMFVSLTPGAIGFRETFLILSQSLHHIPLASIIVAGIIDRAIYVIFLALLFLISSTLHLKNMFINKK
jgi:uncharacterized membrane protein YbhN (UPF0104 family)